MRSRYTRCSPFLTNRSDPTSLRETSTSAILSSDATASSARYPPELPLLPFLTNNAHPAHSVSFRGETTRKSSTFASLFRRDSNATRNRLLESPLNRVREINGAAPTYRVSQRITRTCQRRGPRVSRDDPSGRRTPRSPRANTGLPARVNFRYNRFTIPGHVSSHRPVYVLHARSHTRAKQRRPREQTPTSGRVDAAVTCNSISRS